MKARWVSTVAVLGLGCAQGPAAAHHSFAAEFDRSLPVTVTGTVTKVEWANPHARFYIDAKDESGATAIEYGLIATLIGVAIIVGAGLVGTRLNTLFTSIAGKLVMPA